MKVNERLVVRKEMNINELERLSNITLKTQIKVNEQFVVRKDHMDVNEHERDHPTLHLRHKLK